ncbi:type III secretion system translocon subunit SctE [Cupriavidus gilardii]|uniref:type III secretion system translocon subunit SctE n=1 Tax=Cupriavidus gilardii TaxID=82541 RepID=UPI001ABE8CE6|nr:type III secretion system translocon subunit SctE [Cupriavidus gilardii]
MSSLLKPPPSAMEAVDARAAGEAWDSVIGILSGAVRTAAAAVKGDDKGTELALNDLGKATDSLQAFYHRALNPESVLLQLQLESNRFSADMTRANLENTRDLRKQEVAAIQEKERNAKEAAEKQRQLERKAGKGQIAALALGWATSLAQVVTGALKLATGQPTGILDLSAGLVGVAKCTLQSVQMAHPELAGKLGSHIKELAKWEMGLGMAAGVVSLVSVARMAKVANAVLGKAAGTVLQTGAESGTSSVGVTLVRAMDQGGDAASQLARNIAKTLVDDVGAQLRNALQVFPGRQCVVDAVTKAFSNQALETMVEQALLQAAKQMRGMTTEALTSGFIQQVQKQLLRSVVRAAVKVAATLDAPLIAAKVVAPATQQIVHNALRIDAADRKEEIDRMMIRAMMLQFVIDLIGRQVKENKNALERVTRDQVDTTQRISTALSETRDVALEAVGAGV